mmetsp:Transcript_15983/g.32471  ORF Transcript_15983/g.32471 Transcript_15983/m.32471 type:complete len:418 (-) Transcript_15983:58-1311(-)
MWPLLQWASVVSVCAVSVLVGWRLEVRRANRSLEARPVYDLPRTTLVLDHDDCAYLSKFYRSNVASWTQTYFNMLVHRWNNQDERMESIFKKVISAANRIDGGSGDYTITNDFFSYRAPGVVQFAMNGIFHTDCDFWKTKAADGFNLWILVDHDGLDTSFDFLERKRNPSIYEGYDGRRSAYLLARNGSDAATTFRAGLLSPVAFRRGHGDVLSWRGSLQVAFRQVMRPRSQRRLRERPERFNVSGINASRVRLAVGEALVLREQELHRTDLHTQLAEGQFRLVAGFKLQRRNATIEQFDMSCTAQRDRFNLPLLWEQVGMPMLQVYTASPGTRFVYLEGIGKVRALLGANSYTLLSVAVAGAIARGSGVPAVRALSAAVVAMLAPLAFVVVTQREWFAAGTEALAGEGGRLRSAIQ